MKRKVSCSEMASRMKMPSLWRCLCKFGLSLFAQLQLSQLNLKDESGIGRDTPGCTLGCGGCWGVGGGEGEEGRESSHALCPMCLVPGVW